MSAQGLNYNYSGNYLPYDIWQVYYAFSGQTGGYIPSISGALPQCSGQIVQGDPSAFQGTGFFDKSTVIKVSNSTGDLTDWTILCQFSKLDIDDGIIFSSFTDGIANSGFVFGITAGNRMYVESYDESGPISYTSDIILADKNIVAVSKVGQSLFFDYFNANDKEIESQKTEFYRRGFLVSNEWYIGGSNNTPNGFVGKNFSGLITDFALFNQPLRPEEIKLLCRGLTSDVAGGQSFYNTGNLVALGMNAICYLKDLDPIDTTELYLITGKDNKTGVNFDGYYDSVVDEFYAHDIIEGTGLHVYLNGAAQLGLTGYNTTGSFYDTVPVPTGNYFPSGMKIYSNRVFDREDRLVYDVNNFSTEFFGFYNKSFSHTGGSNQTFITNDSLLDAVFFNGVKLVINKDYVASGSSGITFQTGNSLYDGASGWLWSAPVDVDYSRSAISGLQSSYSKFARNASMFWVNGLRQNLHETYLEVSSRDLLNGTGIFSSENIMFSDEGTFFFSFGLAPFSGYSLLENASFILLEDGSLILLG
jgi:hypothetical protein